jgi:predicted DNA-binding helix-hairpin-helix protein
MIGIQLMLYLIQIKGTVYTHVKVIASSFLLLSVMILADRVSTDIALPQLRFLVSRLIHLLFEA